MIKFVRVCRWMRRGDLISQVLRVLFGCAQQQEDCWGMGCSEKDFCIKCDKGGKLLVCSESGCPIVVHEKCLGRPARFDDGGNFYCPYCLYRHAIAKSHHARQNAMSKKKALSTFIDEEMMDCHKQKEGSAKGNGGERTQLGVAENVEKSRFSVIENGPANTDVSNFCIRLGEDKEEEFADGCTSISPCRGANISLLDKQNDSTAVRERDGAHLRDSDHHQLFGHRTKSVPLVISGRDDVGCNEETIDQFDVVGVCKRFQEKLPGQNDDFKLDKNVNHDRETGHLSGTSVVEEKTSKRTRDDKETFEENGSGSAEEEHAQVQEQETTASWSEDDSNLDIHLEAQREGNTSNKMCEDLQSVRRRSKRIKQIGAHKAQTSAALSRRSSPKVRKTPSKIEKANASSKSRKPESFTKLPRNSFLHGRRKKLCWTEDEEEMLKEGVEKFSSTANKNLPWRKILEFGQHVFDSTRTPVDLKDKWRNILAKED